MRGRGAAAATLAVAALAAGLWLALRDAGRLPASSGDGGRAAPSEPAPPAPASDDRVDRSDPTLRADAAPTDPASRAVHGRVVDARTQEGVADATLVLFEDERVARTDADGAFRFESVETDRQPLFVWHPRYVAPGLDRLLAPEWDPKATPFVEAVAGAVEPLVVRVAPGRRVEGRVVDGEGRPVPGARLRAPDGAWREALERRLSTSLLGWESWVPLVADGDGRFSVACLPGALREARLGAVAPGHVGRWSDAFSLDPNEPAIELELRVLRSASVSGRVATADGSPPSSAGVGLTWSSRRSLAEGWAFEPPQDVAAATDGTYRIDGLPPAAVTLAAEWADPWLGGPEQEVPALRPGEPRLHVDFVLPARYVLVGTLRDPSGRGLGDESLLARTDDPGGSDDTSTDDHGRFRLALRSPGPYDLLHLLPGPEDRVLRSAVVLPSEPLDLVSEPSPRTSIVLQVVDPGGAPVPRFRSAIEPLPRRKERQGSFVSDVDGRDGRAQHVVRGVAPFGVVVGQPADESGQPLPYASRRVRVDTVPVDGVVRLALPRDDVMSGRFVDGDRRPVAGVVLTPKRVSLSERRQVTGTPVVSDRDGRFTIVLGPQKDRFHSADVAVPPGYASVGSIGLDPTDGRTIALAAGGVLAGRVVSAAPLRGDDALGLPAPSVWVAWEGGALQAPLAHDGTWRVESVPLGVDLSVTLPPLTATSNGYLAPRAATGLRAGRLDVDFVLVEGAQIAGRCLDASGKPAGGGFHAVAFPVAPKGSASIAVVGEDGTFVARGLSPGPHRVRLTDPEHDVLLFDRLATPGETITFRVPVRATLRIRLTGTETLRNLEIHVYDAGTTFERVGRRLSVGTAAVDVALVPEGRYDLAVVDRVRDRVGVASGARPGEDATVVMGEGVLLAARFRRRDGTPWEPDDRLYARGPGSCFELEAQGEDWLGALVPPGRYEVVAVARDGTRRTIARDLTAGAEGLEVVVD